MENVNIAIKQAEEYGFLGKNILGSGFDFTVKVHRGAGAFVSGEKQRPDTVPGGQGGRAETEAAISGRKGLWDKPTNINNVETWANVPLIINKGAEWFTSIGTEGSKGTKIFSLVGKVNNTGLVEVPMGITLRDISIRSAAASPEARSSRPCRPAGRREDASLKTYLDMKVDFDELHQSRRNHGFGRHDRDG